MQKTIHEDLTYRELYDSIDNIWSALFMTGYLTQTAAYEGNVYELAIPNNEIRSLYAECAYPERRYRNYHRVYM